MKQNISFKRLAKPLLITSPLIILCLLIIIPNIIGYKNIHSNNIFRFGVQPEARLAKASALVFSMKPEKVIKIIESKEPKEREYLAKIFGAEEFTKKECWKEECRIESVFLEKQQEYDVLFYRYIADQSGRGKALFIFYKNYNGEKKFICMLEFKEYGAQVNNAERTFEYNWKSLVEDNGVKELVVKDYFGGHALSEKCIRIFKIINGNVKEIFENGLGGYHQVADFKYESYEAEINIDEKVSFPKKIEIKHRDTTLSLDRPWEVTRYIWDINKQEYTKK